MAKFEITALCDFTIRARVPAVIMRNFPDRQNNSRLVPTEGSKPIVENMSAGETMEVTLIEQITPRQGMPVFAVKHPPDVGGVEEEPGIYRVRKVAE